MNTENFIKDYLRNKNTYTAKLEEKNKKVETSINSQSFDYPFEIRKSVPLNG